MLRFLCSFSLYYKYVVHKIYLFHYLCNDFQILIEIMRYYRLLIILVASIVFPGNITVKAQKRKAPNVAVGVNHRTEDSLLHSKLNIGLFGNVDTLRGVQASIFSSVAREEMRGLNIGGLTAFSHGNGYGLQMAGFLNGANGEMRGVQLSGISNLALTMNGLQLAGLSNVSTTPMRGMQLSGVTNISMGVKRGIQMAAGANISSSYMRGLQLGSYNYADTLNGSQIGLINVCMNHPRGVQIGIVNYSRDTICHKIGLVNVNPKTTIDLMAYAGNLTKGNMAVRFRNRSTYNMIGVGTHYMGFDEDFSGALFYRIGQYFNLTPRLSISGDLGFYHIETFEKNSAEKPERLYSLQARLNLDYQINSTLGAFASVGYADTRYYYHSHRYHQRPIFEAGLTLRYDRTKSEESEDVSSASDYWLSDSNSQLLMSSLNADQLGKPNYLMAAIETFGINAGVWAFDRYILNADFAKISGKTIAHNFKNGFVWDNDQFSTNLFAHPYHGGLYFNAARTNGLNFWQSVPYSFGGSLMWEIVCEKEPPAINDFIATSVGGVCIGEVTNRLSALVLDDSKRGWPRFWREFLGTVICPIRGLNRIISGDAWRVKRNGNKYHDHESLPIDFSVAAGARYLADNNALFRGESNPYINLALEYGEPYDKEQNKPYDYFTADITFGLSGNQPLINSIHLLGRLWGTPLNAGKHMKAEFGVYQYFNYYDSQPVKDGSSLVPYRISEAAALGPGLIYKFQETGNLTKLEQRVFLSGILLGGSLSDHYNIIDRDYNLGSGFSAKVKTIMDFGRYVSFNLDADFYKIFTWKGYEDKDLETENPLYLNTQGDKSNASLLVVSPKFTFNLRNNLGIDFSASYYLRDTNYKYHDDVLAETFEIRLGLRYSL